MSVPTRVLPDPSRLRLALLTASLSALAPPLHAADGAAGSELLACVAEVSVPATYREESEEVVRRAAGTRFEIEPARFEPRSRRLVVSPARDVVEVVQPRLEAEVQRHEISPATTRWVRDSLEGERPMSPGDRLDLIAAGIDVESVPVGTCLVERFRAPRVEDAEARVLVREASERLVATEAVLESVRQPVTMRPAHTRLIEVPTVRSADGASVEQAAMLTRVREPAVRESVDVERLSSDASVVREPVPAEWGSVAFRRVEAPGAYLWRAEGSGADGEPVLAAATGSEEDVVESGRRLCHREVAAEFVEYERLVVREPGSVERERLDEKVEVLEVQALMADARGERVEVPAVVERVENRVLVTPERIERREVLCRSEATRPVVTALQRALDREGFPVGRIDGQMGPATRNALKRFQDERGLASGALTVESVEALGVAR